MKVDRPIKQRRRQTPIKISELSGASFTGRRVGRSVGAEFDTAPWTLTKKHGSSVLIRDLFHHFGCNDRGSPRHPANTPKRGPKSARRRSINTSSSEGQIGLDRGRNPGRRSRWGKRTGLEQSGAPRFICVYKNRRIRIGVAELLRFGGGLGGCKTLQDIVYIDKYLRYSTRQGTRCDSKMLKADSIQVK
jgi:hypothetical protein